MAPTPASGPGTAATAENIRRVFGGLDDAKLLEIIALRPTIADIEEASLWLAGDADVFGGRPLPPLRAEIIAILTAEEEEEERRAR